MTALVVLAVGFLMVSYPLARHLSDSFDFLLTRRLPLWITLLALALEEWLVGKERTDFDVSSLINAASAAECWGTALPMLKVLTMEAGILLHQAVPPLPLAALLPVWLVMATAAIHRYPYRYQREKLRAEQRIVLLVMSALTMVWSGLFVFARGSGATAELASVLQPVTLIFSSLATAAYQVWLARSVIQWAEPRDGEMRVWDETIARWENVLWLGAFNAAWRAFGLWIGPEAGWLPWSGLVEVLLVFAPLPVAIAAKRGSLSETGGHALRMLSRGWWLLLLWLVTAVLLKGLAEWAVETSAMMSAQAARVVSVLVAGMIHALLVPTALLMLYRRGFPSQDVGLP